MNYLSPEMCACIEEGLNGHATCLSMAVSCERQGGTSAVSCLKMAA